MDWGETASLKLTWIHPDSVQREPEDAQITDDSSLAEIS